MEWLHSNLSTIAICAFTVALMFASLYTASAREAYKRRADAAERSRYRRTYKADLYAAAIERERVTVATSKVAVDAAVRGTEQ